MVRAAAPAGFSVEIFVEKQQFIPPRIGDESLFIAVTWPAAIFVCLEDFNQARSQFVGHLLEATLATASLFPQ